ncbi:MAG TPA: type II toxin-antitoxin system VapC family toxin [Dehalococcoidia bacterium]|nr:type II toxin-antitoxin system VapC family toxin [Dehalococcoidia bacterium]
MDASTVLAYVLREAHTRAVAAFLEALADSDRLFAPGLLLAECTSVLRRKVHGRILTDEEAATALEVALSLPITTVLEVEQHRLAMTFSARRNKSRAYDEHYLAVAALSGTEIVTIDGGMYQGAVEMGIPARLLR